MSRSSPRRSSRASQLAILEEDGVGDLVYFVDKSRRELSRRMNANDVVPTKRSEPSSIMPDDNAKLTIMPLSRRTKSVRAKRWFCKVLVGEVECEKIGMMDGMCHCHFNAFKASGRPTKG